jgi:hypothetical protein
MPNAPERSDAVERATVTVDGTDKVLTHRVGLIDDEIRAHLFTGGPVPSWISVQGLIADLANALAKSTAENAQLRADLSPRQHAELSFAHQKRAAIRAEQDLAALQSRIAEQAAELASLRADAEAVRAVEQWKGKIEHVQDHADGSFWFAIMPTTFGRMYVANAPTLVELGRALPDDTDNTNARGAT